MQQLSLWVLLVQCSLIFRLNLLRVLMIKHGHGLSAMRPEVGGGGQNDLDISSGNPSGSASYQWQISYDGGVTWSNAPGPTAVTTQYVLNPMYINIQAAGHL